jgi:hypothetical protein
VGIHIVERKSERRYIHTHTHIHIYVLQGSPLGYPLSRTEIKTGRKNTK